jgi:endonuclease YncB( thermonuclease family)
MLPDYSTKVGDYLRKHAVGQCYCHSFHNHNAFVIVFIFGASMKILLILLLLLPAYLHADIYKWTDTDGKQHFSDRGTIANAEKITVKVNDSFFTVSRVFDGDTVLLNDGRKVRLLGINTPEVKNRNKQGDAGGEEAKQWLMDKLKNTRVRLETDVEKNDSYGRTLAYLITEKQKNVNVALVAAGLAQVNIFPPNLKYVKQLVEAGQQAEAAQLGLWKRPEYAAIPVEQLTEEGHSGWTRLIGKVRAVNPARRFVYLEFTDRFNARIDMADHTLFPAWQSYQGKTIEVRGWLNKRGDIFSMLIRHPSAIK